MSDEIPEHATRTLTSEEFAREFTLVEFDGGEQVTLDRLVMRSFPENRVWTLVDDGEGGLALCSGFATVNFLGWQVTQEPHPGGNGDIVVEFPEDREPIEVEIVNIYEDGERITVQATAEVRTPDSPDDEDELDEWAEECIFPLTGTGKEQGDAAYFAKITKFDAMPELVGREFEWGI